MEYLSGKHRRIDSYWVEPKRPPIMQYCQKCVYPIISAIPLELNEDKVCTGCTASEEKLEIDWNERFKELQILASTYKRDSLNSYDCIIPVSGGKDSFYQVHIVRNVLGLKPLLVTYDANNWTDVGKRNLERMKEVFDCDHIMFTTSIQKLKALNRLGMYLMGDMNWHAHAGIFTYPLKIATHFNIPLMFWGEHGLTDLAGVNSHYDYVEFTYRERHEYALRGYEVEDILKYTQLAGENLNLRDLNPYVYPTDEEVNRLGLRGIFLSNYIDWNSDKQTDLMIKEYGFEPADNPFDRTYRLTSNLDDMHENGLHDYMKFIKFGYGRATDHASKDIRAGRITRDEAILLVKKYDEQIPNDIDRWCEYVGWSKTKFFELADRFRDSRVWWKTKDNKWRKDNIYEGT